MSLEKALEEILNGLYSIPCLLPGILAFLVFLQLFSCNILVYLR
jgi:hypothetical protein